MANEESNEQIKVVDWCRANKIFVFAVPNGSHIAGSAAQRARKMHFMKKEGMLVGASDLVVMLDKVILFIEMKKRKKLLKNGSLSSAGISISEFQLQFLDQVKEYDYATSTIAYGADEAIKYIKKHKGVSL